MKADPAPPGRTTRPLQTTLVLYLRDTTGIPYTDDAAVTAAFARDPVFQQLAERYGGTAKLAPRRAFKANLADLRRLGDKASKNAERNGVRGYRPLQFDHYFLVTVPKGSGKPPFDLYCDLKAAAAARGGRVFVSLPTKSAQASNDYVGPAASGGIGAAGLTSNNKSIDGSGQALVDIEKGWMTTGGMARTLPSSVPVAESGELGDMGHGAAAASIICGGGTAQVGGIAPNATFFKGACIEPGGTMDPSQILASTILDAALQLEKSPGGTGVILIEQETWDAMPIESQPLEFGAIATAVAAGHIVIEPAGNGAQSLDSATGYTLDANGESVARPLDPTAGGPTSGAIVVAAGQSGIGGSTLGERSATSNFGNLVDCWAWGDSIAALTVSRDASGDPILIDDTMGFGGTSGASAMIAGAVVLMQHLRAEANHAQLTPSAIRALLKFGTPGRGDLTGKMMPNLGDSDLRDEIEQSGD